MPRFVLLAHDYPVLHWDLMLEAGESLRTWRLASFPGPAQEIPAEALAPHRLAYLEYEGPVSGGRGTVRRIAAGEYTILSETAAELQIAFASAGFPQMCVLTHQQGSQWIARFAISRGTAEEVRSATS